MFGGQNKIQMSYLLQGENLALRLCVPEKSTSRNILVSLARSAKIVDRGGKEQPETFGKTSHTNWGTKTMKRCNICVQTKSMAVHNLE